MGSESFVSQPSTGIWKARTIANATQYWTVVKIPVRNQPSSNATTARTATAVKTVYSGTGRLLPGRRRWPAQPGQDVTDRLVGQEPTDGDHEKEDDLLHRQ